MALLKASSRDIPTDAVQLTEIEALEYQTNNLRNWKNSSDVFAFKYGTTFLASGSALAGIYFNNYFRNKYHLLNYGRLATYFPACIIPSCLSFIAHTQFVLTSIVLQKGDCPVCIEMRASAIQATAGCVFPYILSHVGAISIAQKYVTVDIPYITKEPLKALKFIQKQARPITNVFFVILTAQALLASVITYFENKSVYTVNSKLLEIESMIENS